MPRRRDVSRSCGELTEIQKRRLDITKMLLRKVNATEIARRVGCEVRTVYNIANSVRSEWKTETLGLHEDHLVELLASLNSDEGALRKRWEATTSTRVWLTIYDRILKVIERRVKLLGLDAPEEIRLDVGRVQHIVAELVAVVCRHVEDVDVRKAIAEEAQLLLARAGGNTTPTVQAYVDHAMEEKDTSNDACEQPPTSTDSSTPNSE